MIAQPSFSARLIEARRDGRRIAATDGPATIDAAYGCQADILAALGSGVAGWKVALPPGQGAVAAPLPSVVTVTAPASWTWGEGLAIELEIAVRLGRDLPPGPISRADLVAAIDGWVFGIEMVRHRLESGSAAPFPCFLADSLANEGYVVGPAVPADLDLSGRTCRATLDGAALVAAPAVHPQGDTLAPLVAWAAVQADRCGGLKAGQIVTTGALCGLVPVPGPGLVEATLDGFEPVRIAVLPAA
ncbi:fumarylacetoacetate hydrolase family protein [Prosthecomicrobium hirschii]|uniref:fumarylacetoacetate hydrolase family protein n=1 Tax=Prosthecodimorpha hirschii TaxID=665126 RepID=UPI002220CF95|nr:fumarylacetoacetate hydrolase family protein [Prosthecomicrobium hirschii]MCW1841044.1 fumarylacetoacetate hydrolase family protein [Prosthecomicrobium hirschii]